MKSKQISSNVPRVKQSCEYCPGEIYTGSRGSDVISSVSHGDNAKCNWSVVLPVDL